MALTTSPNGGTVTKDDQITITYNEAWAASGPNGDICAYNGGNPSDDVAFDEVYNPGPSSCYDEVGNGDGTYYILWVDYANNSCYGSLSNTRAGCKATGDYLGTEIEFCIGASCGGGGGSSTPSTATTTDVYSQSQVNLAFGILLLLIGFFGMIWLIRKH